VTNLNTGDEWLHHPDGSHRSTPASKDGRFLDAFSTACTAHLDAHDALERAAEVTPPPVDVRGASLFANDHAAALVTELEVEVVHDPSAATRLVRTAMQTLEAAIYHRPSNYKEATELLAAFRRGVAAAALVCDRSAGRADFLARRVELLPHEPTETLVALAYSMICLTPGMLKRMAAFVAQVESDAEAELRQRLKTGLELRLHALHEKRPRHDG